MPLGSNAGIEAASVDVKANRQRLAELRRELFVSARRELADRYQARAPQVSELLRDWLLVEEVYLRIQAGDDLERLAELCQERLGPAPSRPETAGSDSTVEHFQSVLRNRYLTMASYLATLRATQEVLSGSVLEYINAGIDQASVAAPVGTAGADRELGLQLESWKSAKFDFLIALDEPDLLEESLKSWISDEVDTVPWRLKLAQLVAEQGRFAEAIEQFEWIEHHDELSPYDYETLAIWYTVVNRQEDYERAMRAAFDRASEQQLEDQIDQQLTRYEETDGSAPARLDNDILLMFAALLDKAGDPSVAFSYLRQFYQTTRDERLLRVLPPSVVGKSVSGIYGFLESVEALTSQIQDEATVDALNEAISRVREATLSDTDARALDLMQLLVERQASTMDNQPGPHIVAMRNAMERAFEHEFVAGEPLMMTKFLYDLGTLSDKGLHDEQLRQIHRLRQTFEPGSYSHLKASSLTARLMWSYGQRDEALGLFESSITAYRQANDGAWPQDGNPFLGQYVSLLEQAGWYSEGESLLSALLQEPANPSQANFLGNRLNRLYYGALENGAPSRWARTLNCMKICLRECKANCKRQTTISYVC